MPYKDINKRRLYDRQYKQRVRLGLPTSKNLLPTPFKLKTAQDILALLLEQIETVKNEPEAGTLEKARVVGYLAGITLKAVEVAGLESRIDKLEEIFNRRMVS
jgi:hypothetical protein